MTGHINWSAVLSTLLLIVVLAVGPGAAGPASAAETPGEAESPAPVAPEDSTDAPEESPAPSPSKSVAAEVPVEPEQSPSEAPESAAPTEPEDSSSATPEDDDAAAQVEDDATEKEPAPQQRMQRNWGGSNTATVEVKVGGSRSESSVTPLAGAQLGLFSSLRSSTPVNRQWGVCTSNPDGICTFSVPDAGSGYWQPNRDAQLFVKAISAPQGYSTVAQMGVGGPGQVSSSSYGFRVGEKSDVSQCSYWGCSTSTIWELRGGETYRSFDSRGQSGFMSADGASSGVFPFIRDNPALPSRCGMSVAVIMDLSSSMSGSEDSLAQTADAVVDQLQGSPSSVSIFSFGTSSPASNAWMPRYDTTPQSVRLPRDADAVRDLYSKRDARSSWQRRANFWIHPSAEGTNWDRGLGAAGEMRNPYDAAVIITDGNPTFFGNRQGDGRSTRFSEVENAVFTANALKAEGTRVIAVGTGNREISSSVSSGNLLSISGPGATIQNTSFSAARDELAGMLEQNCASSVAVDKTWVINGTEYAQGTQPEGINAELRLSAPGGSTGETRQAAWAEPHEGYSAGDQVRLNEDLNISEIRPGCSLDHSEVSAINSAPLDTPTSLAEGGFRSDALSAGLTRFSVTSTVTCEQSLTLTMEAKDKRAEASRWKLSAYSTPADPRRGKPVLSGSQGVKSRSIAAGQTLQLAAEQGPEVFVQDDRRLNPSRAPLATGSWTCVHSDGRGSAPGTDLPVGGEDGTVQVPLGADLNCKATSRTAEATLLKHVVNEHGGTIVPEDFQLQAAPTTNGTVLASKTVPGSGAPSASTAVLVRPAQSYTVSEESLVENLAFRTGELQRYTGAPTEAIDHEDARLWETVSDGEITVEADGAEIYRLVSYDIAPSVLPQTGGLGSMPYLIGGGALITLAALAGLKLRHPARKSRRLSA